MFLALADRGLVSDDVWRKRREVHSWQNDEFASLDVNACTVRRAAAAVHILLLYCNHACFYSRFVAQLLCNTVVCVSRGTRSFYSFFLIIFIWGFFCPAAGDEPAKTGGGLMHGVYIYI